MGQIDESMPHFHSALELLSSRLPRSFAAGTCALLYQCFKQFLHSRFPSRFHAHMQGSEPFLDTERCLSLVSHIYRHQNRDMMSLMAALKHLNAAEAARNYYSSEVSVCTLMRPLNETSSLASGSIHIHDRTLPASKLQENCQTLLQKSNCLVSCD